MATRPRNPTLVPGLDGPALALRDVFAAAALVGLLARDAGRWTGAPGVGRVDPALESDAYEIADAMLVERATRVEAEAGA